MHSRVCASVVQMNPALGPHIVVVVAAVVEKNFIAAANPVPLDHNATNGRVEHHNTINCDKLLRRGRAQHLEELDEHDEHESRLASASCAAKQSMATIGELSLVADGVHIGVLAH